MKFVPGVLLRGQPCRSLILSFNVTAASVQSTAGTPTATGTAAFFSYQYYHSRDKQRCDDCSDRNGTDILNYPLHIPAHFPFVFAADGLRNSKYAITTSTAAAADAPAMLPLPRTS